MGVHSFLHCQLANKQGGMSAGVHSFLIALIVDALFYLG